MHSGLFPSKNGAHRLACLSLYRALLRKCGDFSPKAASGSSASNTSSSSTLRALVRHRFRGDRKVKRFTQITDALQFGKSILQLLEDATAGSTKALEEMRCIVSSIPQLVCRNKEVLKQVQNQRGQRQLPNKIVRGKVREARLANKANYQRKQDVAPVLQRPVPYEQALKDKSGRRRVPNYFVVQGIPFLRYGHAQQPLALGRYIATRVKDEIALWDKSAKHEEMVALADLEDQWDGQMQTDHHVQQAGSLKGQRESAEQWNESPRAALKLTQAKVKELGARDMRWSEKLWDVYMKESAIAKLENSARKEMRRQQWEQGLVQEANKDQRETERVSALFKDLQTNPAVEEIDKPASDAQPSSPPNHRQKRRFKAARKIVR